MIALSLRRQTICRPAEIEIQGVRTAAKRCDFGDVVFTVDLRTANALLDVVMTLYRSPGADSSTARLSYFQHPTGFASVFPFQLKFECTAGGRTKAHDTIVSTVAVGMRAAREQMEVPLSLVSFNATTHVTLLPAVQMCSKFS